MPFSLLLGSLPFVRSDRSDHSRRNDNFPFNQNSPARSVKSWRVCTKEMVFQQKLLKKAYFIFKLTGRAMVRPSSSDKWKAPLVNPFTANNSLRTQTYFLSSLLSSVFAGYANKSQSKKIYIPNFVSENPNIWIATPFRILSQMQKLECQIISPLISLEGKGLRFLCSFLCE